MTKYSAPEDQINKKLRPINTSKLTKCKLEQILGSKQYYLVLLFFAFSVEWSVGFLFIWFSGFGLRYQLRQYRPTWKNLFFLVQSTSYVKQMSFLNVFKSVNLLPTSVKKLSADFASNKKMLTLDSGSSSIA